MLVGYVRVSRNEQNLDLQLDSLNKLGIEKVFKEKTGGASKDRPEFDRMLTLLRSGDVIVVWRIDRLGRSTLSLVQLMAELRERGIEFRSIIEGVDTTTPMGRLWYTLSAVFAENEREIIRERTIAGLAAARLRGRKGGRRFGLSDKAKQTAKTAKILYDSGQSVSNILKAIGIRSSTTLYKYLRHEGVKFGKA
jgi:DNA invertase Pin-like site-specific DNA recombinase